jgi:ribosomal protein S18 acetylase RimI-like enzyme
MGCRAAPGAPYREAVANLLTRAYCPTDAPAVADLLNLVDEHAGGHGGTTADGVTSFVATLVPDPGADTRLVFAGDVLVAAGITAPPPPGGFRVDLIGGVHPNWRGQGLGRTMLAWQIDRAEQMHKEIAPDAVWQAQRGIELDDHDAVRLFQRYALTPVRYWFEMTADTVAAPAVPAPVGVTIVAYQPAYESAVHEAHMAAFRDHWGFQYREREEWLELTVRQKTFLPRLSRVVLDGDELAGYLLAHLDTDPSRVHIGLIGVKRPWRRRGLAGAMLADVLRAARLAGHTCAALGVDADSLTGAVGVYERVGFRIDHRAVTYSRSLGL